MSETGIFVIFCLCSVYIMEISQNAKQNLDDVLVGLVNSIMFIQMAGSIFIFSKTVWIVIKLKFAKKVAPVNLKTEDPNRLDELDNVVQKDP